MVCQIIARNLDEMHNIVSLKATIARKLAEYNVMAFRYTQGDRAERLASITRVSHDRQLLLTPCEAATLITLVRAAQKLPGVLAEVGVAFGASARLISEHSNNRTLHLFDTFVGLPRPGHEDKGTGFKEGQYACDMDSVEDYLGNCNIVLHKGIFPQDTGRDADGERFAFVHLDIDLYKATLASLGWFYPRMSRGGIILVHDFFEVGVSTAVSEFFEDHPDPVIELTGNQCMIVRAC